MTHLDDALWKTVQSAMPILCVDVVPIRVVSNRREVGLIRRPFADTGEPVWCHLGGRILRGETTGEAVRRHVQETLTDADVDLGPDPQPHHVMQWFPQGLRSCVTYGVDPRQHAVSLCWALDLGPSIGTRDGGEGDAFAWFAAALPEGAADYWPGTAHLVASTLAGADMARDT